jgi:hypothetical protein
MDTDQPASPSATERSCDRRPLHVPYPPKDAPRPIARNLEIANTHLKQRLDALAATRKHQEEVTLRAFTARVQTSRAKIAELESSDQHENRYREAFDQWRRGLTASAAEKHRHALASALVRQREQAAEMGSEALCAARQRLMMPDDSPPCRVATHARYDRLLAPLAGTQPPDELQRRLGERMQEFTKSMHLLQTVRTSNAQRKQESRTERETLARQRLAERDHHVQQLHVAKAIRSEAACRRAARTKARISNPRRALAEDRLAARQTVALEQSILTHSQRRMTVLQPLDTPQTALAEFPLKPTKP